MLKVSKIVGKKTQIFEAPNSSLSARAALQIIRLGLRMSTTDSLRELDFLAKTGTRSLSMSVRKPNHRSLRTLNGSEKWSLKTPASKVPTSSLSLRLNLNEADQSLKLTTVRIQKTVKKPKKLKTYKLSSRLVH